jgi:hypothetical protein
MSGVTHPGEFGLLELVLGNDADPEASKARLHLQEGCVPCEETLRQLTGLKKALEDERAFDASFADLKGAFSPVPTGGRAGQTEPAAALAQDLLERLGDRDAMESLIRSSDASPERGLAPGSFPPTRTAVSRWPSSSAWRPLARPGASAGRLR